MKVVFSDKLRRVLQDPQASAQLRQFMTTASANQPSPARSGLNCMTPRLLSTFAPGAEQ